MSDTDKEIATNDDLDMLDSLLEGLDLSPDVSVKVEPTEIEDILELEILPEVERELELAAERRELYESAEAAPLVPTPPIAAPRKKTVKTATAATPRVRTSIDNLDARNFILTPADEADPEAAKTRVLAARPVQKKVNEKFENLFCSLAAGREPSNYVVKAFNVLDTNKSVTSSALVSAFKLNAWSEGTSRSQVGQIMHLFGLLKIADRAGSSLTLRDDSAIAERLRKVIATAA